MKILITGSQGTLGRPLRRELEARGHEVWGCDVGHADGERYFRADVASHRQLIDALLWDGNLPEFDVVYHLGAEFGRHNGEQYFEEVWQSNAIGTRNLLELQRSLRFKLIFASSSEIYGDCDGVLDEALTDRQPVWPANDYALSKWVNEQQIMNFAKRYGNESMRLRIFNTYGPGEHYHPYRSVVCQFVYRALHGLPLDVYRGYSRAFLYIDDFIPTLANACERFKAGEVYNIAGRGVDSVEKLSAIVLHATGSRSTFSFLEEDPTNAKTKRPDISKAERDLGHNPRVSLEEGVRRTVEWMREVYKIPAEVTA